MVNMALDFMKVVRPSTEILPKIDKIVKIGGRKCQMGRHRIPTTLHLHPHLHRTGAKRFRLAENQIPKTPSTSKRSSERPNPPGTAPV